MWCSVLTPYHLHPRLHLTTRTTRQPDTGTFAPLRASRDHRTPSYIYLSTPQTDCDPLARPPSPRRNRAPSPASRPRILYQQRPHPNEPPADFFYESITTISISPRSLPCPRSCRLHVSATWSLDSPPRTPHLSKKRGREKKEKRKKKRKRPKNKCPPSPGASERNNPRAIRTENFHVLTRYSGLGPLLPQPNPSTVAALRCAYFLRQTSHPTRSFQSQSGGVGAAATPLFKMMLEEKYGLSPLDRSSQQQQRAASPVQAADCDMAAAVLQ